MSVTILIPRSWSIVDRILSRRHPGKPPRQLRIAWLDGLLSRRFTCIRVCSLCRYRWWWDLKRRGYRQDHEGQFFGRCRYCQDETWTTAFYSEESFTQLRGTTPARRRQEAGAIRFRDIPSPVRLVTGA